MFVNLPKAELEGPRVEPGDHAARIHSAKLKESAAKNQVLTIMWKLTGTEPPAGTMVPDIITLVPEAYWKLALMFQATGFSMDENGFNTEELVGKEAIITVIQEEYQGMMRSKVNGYKKA